MSILECKEQCIGPILHNTDINGIVTYASNKLKKSVTMSVTRHRTCILGMGLCFTDVALSILDILYIAVIIIIAIAIAHENVPQFLQKITIHSPEILSNKEMFD